MEDKINLIPGQKYLIKSVTDNNNWVILECEFIKYYNNQYLDAFMDYFDPQNEGEPPSVELVGTVLDNTNAHNILMPANFDNELYPYYRYTISTHISRYIGLFRFIKIIKLVYKGENIDPSSQRVTETRFKGNRMFSPF
jgi:hypothetical protein